jgi:hypothetical protein
VAQVLSQQSQEKALKTLFRVFDAQPYLLKVWNLAALFTYTLATQDEDLSYMLLYMRKRAAPSNVPLQQDYQAHSKNIDRLVYLQGLRLNRHEELAKQPLLDKLFADSNVVLERVEE